MGIMISMATCYDNSSKPHERKLFSCINHDDNLDFKQKREIKTIPSLLTEQENIINSWSTNTAESSYNNTLTVYNISDNNMNEENEPNCLMHTVESDQQQQSQTPNSNSLNCPDDTKCSISPSNHFLISSDRNNSNPKLLELVGLEVMIIYNYLVFSCLICFIRCFDKIKVQEVHGYAKVLAYITSRNHAHYFLIQVIFFMYYSVVSLMIAYSTN